MAYEKLENDTKMKFWYFYWGEEQKDGDKGRGRGRGRARARGRDGGDRGRSMVTSQAAWPSQLYIKKIEMYKIYKNVCLKKCHWKYV